MGDWEEERREANVALRHSGLPEFDSAGFPIDASTKLSSSAATVVLCSARGSGYALIVPPGALIREAVSIDLPEYSARTAENLAMAKADGWIPALLAWRSSREIASFDAAVRRTSVRLWDCVLGRVCEFLPKLGAHSEVNLVVRGDQRLFPWGCASASSDMRDTLAEQLQLSTGFDLSMLLLGHTRAGRRNSSELAGKTASPLALVS